MKFPVINEGLDPTGIPGCIEKSQILQMVHEAEFVDYVGATIFSATAPDVATYPKLGWFTWHKLLAGVRTGELYYWTGSEWTPQGVPAGTLTGDAFADGSISISKLSTTGAALDDLIRVGTTGFEFISVSALFGANSIALNKLTTAPGADYTLLTNSVGVPEYVDWYTLFATTLAETVVDPYTLSLPSTPSVPNNSVIFFSTPGALASIGPVTDLISANTLATNKLNLAALKGRYVKVNAAGTDFEAATDVGVKVAKVAATALAGVDAQVINTATATVVTLDSEASDPDSIISLAANKIKVAAAGVYEFNIDVPLFLASGNLVLQVELYNVTGAAVLDYRNARIVEGGDLSSATLSTRVTATADQEFSIRIICATAPTNLYLGSPANIGGRNEIYTQVIVRKYA